MVTTLDVTQGLAVRERFGAWQDSCSSSLIPLALRAEDPSAFAARRLWADLGAAAFQNLRFTSHSARRTPALINRSDPECCGVILVKQGTMSVRQSDNATVARPGDLVLYDSSTPFDFRVGGSDGGGDTEVNVLMVPRQLLSSRAKKLKPLLAIRMSTHRGIAAVTAQTLSAAAGQAEDLGPGDAARLGLVLTEMLSALIGHRLDADNEQWPEPGSGTMVLAVERYIAQHLGDPGLNPLKVAAAHHISVRRLYQIFEARGTTVAAHIRQLRLEMVRRDLADVANLATPIQTVAQNWGFPNQSTFSRAFRERYGTAPRDYRKSMQHSGG